MMADLLKLNCSRSSYSSTYSPCTLFKGKTSAKFRNLQKGWMKHFKYERGLKVASLSLLYSYYFGRCSSELAQLVPLPFSRVRSTRYSDRLHDFSVTIPRCYKDVSVKSFFPSTGRLQNFLPVECFPLSYDLSGFKSRINRHLLTAGSF